MLGGTFSTFKYDGTDYTTSAFGSGGASTAKFNTAITGLGGIYLRVYRLKNRILFRLHFSHSISNPDHILVIQKRTFSTYRKYNIKFLISPQALVSNILS